MPIRTKPIKNPWAPLKAVAGVYLRQAITDIEVNFMTQRIYPTEVYRNYEKVNEYRKKHKMWFSTGEGAKSFEGTVYKADETTGDLMVGIRYLDYLRYVDIGVGLTGHPDDPYAHITANMVDRNKKAKYKSRYISKWDRRQGNSHRPAIMRTVRRLAKRYEQHLADYYGYQGLLQIMNALEVDEGY